MSAAIWNMTSFYQFVALPADELMALRAKVFDWFAERDWIGHVLLAEEGVNATVAKIGGDVAEVKTFIEATFGSITTPYKDSVAYARPFQDLRVDIREEIVGLKRPDLAPLTGAEGHLTPSEWHAMLESDEAPLVLDTRNTYETRIGMFKGAVDPGIKTFSNWSRYADDAALDPERPVMIYCTGGIRCEKVMLDLRERGFEKVYQLSGGILAYMEQYPDGYFEGECFVFDDRIAVDAQLQPTTKYGICPGCGFPSEPVDACTWCEGANHTCANCQPEWDGACSKTCRDRVRRHGPRRSAMAG